MTHQPTQQECDFLERRFNDVECKDEVMRFARNADGSVSQNPEWESARYAIVIRAKSIA